MKIKTRRYYVYYTARVLLFFISLIPLKMSLVIADFLGRRAFWIVRKYREITVNNLNAFFGGNLETNLKIGERVFANVAKNGIEWVKLSSLSPKRLGRIVTEFEGKSRLDDVLAGGRGAVVLGFHFGNWELLGLYLRYRGYDGALVARKLYFHKYDEAIVRLRQRYGARVVYRHESPKKMLYELKEGRILGILADQDVASADGVFVDFFGEKAYTPIAPVRIAMVAKTKLVPIFVIRKRDNTHKLVVEEPIDVAQGGGLDEDVKRFTQAWTSLLERYVKRYPEQWVWMHSRWKTQG